VQSYKDAEFRLRMAEGFLDEAKEHFRLKFFRSVVDNSQISIENSAKAVIVLFRPLSKTHEIAEYLNELLQEMVDEETRDGLNRLIDITEQFSFETHVRTDYGDEACGLTPWELFGEEDAKNALSAAQQAFELSKKIINVMYCIFTTLRIELSMNVIKNEGLVELILEVAFEKIPLGKKFILK
jgi:HEPN domain-containing protein